MRGVREYMPTSQETRGRFAGWILQQDWTSLYAPWLQRWMRADSHVTCFQCQEFIARLCVFIFDWPLIVFLLIQKEDRNLWRTRVSFRSYWMTRQSVFSSPTWESSGWCRTGLALFCFLPGKTNNKKCAPKNNVGQNFIRYSRHQQRN